MREGYKYCQTLSRNMSVLLTVTDDRFAHVVRSMVFCHGVTTATTTTENCHDSLQCDINGNRTDRTLFNYLYNSVPSVTMALSQ